MSDEQILRTPAGEPVVLYALVDGNNRLIAADDNERWVRHSTLVYSGDRVIPCHLLPLPEDARTVKREVDPCA